MAVERWQFEIIKILEFPENGCGPFCKSSHIFIIVYNAMVYIAYLLFGVGIDRTFPLPNSAYPPK